MNPISSGQLKRLQVLYQQWYVHETWDAHDPRQVRIDWASKQTGRQITSFRELTRSEAHQLINTLQKMLGIPSGRFPRSRERAQAAGTEGRRGQSQQTVTLASSFDLARIQDALTRLGWSQSRFEAWLLSSRSPLGNKSNPQIRTLAEANRVWWALKRLLQRAGQWAPEPGERA